jgi:hypothetical protein
MPSVARDSGVGNDAARAVEGSDSLGSFEGLRISSIAMFEFDILGFAAIISTKER